jgi:hypothetical protein
MATFNGFILLPATCRSAAIQRERIVAFPWQHSAVLYCWQLHVCQQRCKGNVLLRFRGSIQQFILLTATWMSKAIQRERIVAFPWQHSAVLYCWQLHVCQQQYKGNVLLRFHGSIQQFYVVDSYMYVNSDTKGTYCCISVATFSSFILLTATCRPEAIQRERIVAFPWQHSAVL